MSNQIGSQIGYQNYSELLERSKRDEPMTEFEKIELKRDLEGLDVMEHVEVLRIIHECMIKKVYTVNNKQTMLDLEDLTNKCLWKISYYVKLCLDNQEREKKKIVAEKEHNDKLHELEERMKRNVKLKLKTDMDEMRSEVDEMESIRGGMSDDDDISE
jgi:hypothetical protein